MDEFYFGLLNYVLYTIVLFIYGLLHFRMHYWRRIGIPHSEPFLFRGNLWRVIQPKQQRQQRLTKLYRDTYNKFKGSGPFCGFYFATKPAAVILSLNLAKNMLKHAVNNLDECSLHYNEQRVDMLSLQLFDLHSSAGLSLCSAELTQNILPAVMQVGAKLVQVLNCSFKLQSNCAEIEIKQFLARYICDAIAVGMYSIECNSLQDAAAEFHLMHLNVFQKNSNGISQAFPKWARHFQFHNTYLRFVHKAIEQRACNAAKHSDIMNMLIEMKNSKQSKTRLNVAEISAYAYSYDTASFDCTLRILTCALYEIAQNETVQHELRKEIHEVLSRHNDICTYECMQEMQYLQQVVTETLRKFPLIRHIRFNATADYGTHIAGYTIEKNTTVIIPVEAMQHDADIFPEPERFIPARFDPKCRHKTHLLCDVSNDFAQLLIRIGLISILQKFKLKLGNTKKVTMDNDRHQEFFSSGCGLYIKIEAL